MTLLRHLHPAPRPALHVDDADAAHNAAYFRARDAGMSPTVAMAQADRDAPDARAAKMGRRAQTLDR